MPRRPIGRWIVAASALLGCDGSGAAQGAGAEPNGAGGSAGAAATDGAAGVGASGAAGGSSLTATDSSFIGACLVQMMSPDPDTCRGLDAVYDCARKRCNLDACAAECKDYIACIKAAPDPCTAGISCTHGEPCLTCSTNLAGCIWIDECRGLFVCGTPPVAGGACSKLDACCSTQRDPTACSGFTQQFSLVGGDKSCQMLIDDPGFRNAYTDDPPCAISP